MACLTGCGTASTLVLAPKQSIERYSKIEVIADKPNVDVPAEVSDQLHSAITKGLTESGAFSDGTDLQIVYSFVSYDPGSRAERYLTGGLGNSGEGSIAVIVRYVDRNGKEVAKTQVEGHIGSGFFGGSIDSVVSKISDKIVKYTVENFSNKKA